MDKLGAHKSLGAMLARARIVRELLASLSARVYRFVAAAATA